MQDAQYNRLAGLVFWAALTAHLAFASALPLIEDEAYYTLWSTWPDWGYYDHPPMIAWMIAIGTEVFGNSAFEVRLVPTLSYMLAGLAVWDVARRMATARAGFWALVFFNASLLTVALGSFATPDAPSVFFWAATIWATYRATLVQSWSWWALAGVLGGLGCLSKFTNAFLAVGVLLWFLGTMQGRRCLRGFGPWPSIMCAVLVCLPYLYWNYSLDWIGFERQFGRLQSTQFNVLGPFTFIAMSVLLAGPVIVFLAVKGAGRNLFITLTALPFVLYLLYHATHSEIAANWQAPLHVNIAILAGMGTAAAGKMLLRVAWISSLGLALVVMAILFKPGTPVIAGHIPPNQYRGWDATIVSLEDILSDRQTGWIATADYGLTASFWHNLALREVWSVTEPERYSFRPNFPNRLCDMTALLVVREGQDISTFKEYFETLEQSGTVERKAGDKTLFTYTVYYATGYKDRTRCD